MDCESTPARKVLPCPAGPLQREVGLETHLLMLWFYPCHQLSADAPLCPCRCWRMAGTSLLSLLQLVSNIRAVKCV